MKTSGSVSIGPTKTAVEFYERGWHVSLLFKGPYGPDLKFLLHLSVCSLCLRGDKRAENHCTTETRRSRRSQWGVKLWTLPRDCRKKTSRLVQEEFQLVVMQPVSCVGNVDEAIVF